MYCDIITKDGQKYEFMLENFGGYLRKIRRNSYGCISGYTEVCTRGGSSIYIDKPNGALFVKRCIRLAGGKKNIKHIETQGVNMQIFVDNSIYKGIVQFHCPEGEIRAKLIDPGVYEVFFLRTGNPTREGFIRVGKICSSSNKCRHLYVCIMRQHLLEEA